jgi:DnaK suppressor protein
MTTRSKYFRDLLLSKREQLVAAEVPTPTIELDQTRVGRLSRMDAIQGHEMSLEANRRRVADLVRIDQALTRIDEDDYGFCEECGEAIIEGRLEIDPAAIYCVPCASKHEA